MTGGDNRQLAIAGLAALIVLGGGAAAWFGSGATSENPPTVRAPRDATARTIAPSGRRKEAKAVGSSAARSSSVALTSAVRDPRVRPATMTEAVHQELKVSEAKFQACFAEELAQRPEAKGRAILQFKIDERSEVGAVQVELRGIPSLALKDCFLNVTQTLVFGGVDQPTHVLWPLLMWPDKGLTVQAPAAPLDGD